MCLFQAIENLEFMQGMTNTAESLETLVAMFDTSRGDRTFVPNYCLMLTDGHPTLRVVSFVVWFLVCMVQAI